MESVKRCASKFRILGSLKGKKLEKAIESAPSHLIKCLYELSLNLVYSPYNGFRLYKKLIKKKIKPFETIILRLIKSKRRSDQRKLLKKGGGGVTLAILSLLSSIIASVASMI